MTRKLMLWLTATTIVFWIVAASIGAMIMREEFDEVFDGALQETAQRLMPLVVYDLSQHESSTSPSRVDLGGSKDKEYISYQVRDRDRHVLFRSHDAQRDPFRAPLRRGFSDTSTHRLYTEKR